MEEHLLTRAEGLADALEKKLIDMEGGLSKFSKYGTCRDSAEQQTATADELLFITQNLKKTIKDIKECLS